MVFIERLPAAHYKALLFVLKITSVSCQLLSLFKLKTRRYEVWFCQEMAKLIPRPCIFMLHSLGTESVENQQRPRSAFTYMPTKYVLTKLYATTAAFTTQSGRLLQKILMRNHKFPQSLKKKFAPLGNNLIRSYHLSHSKQCFLR